jgi:O-antigen ligase
MSEAGRVSFLRLGFLLFTVVASLHPLARLCWDPLPQIAVHAGLALAWVFLAFGAGQGESAGSAETIPAVPLLFWAMGLAGTYLSAGASPFSRSVLGACLNETASALFFIFPLVMPEVWREKLAFGLAGGMAAGMTASFFSGVMVNPNLLASYLILGWPWVLRRGALSKGWGRWGWGLVLLAGGGALLATKSFWGFLAVGVQAVLGAWIFRGKLRLPRSAFWVGTGLAAVFGAAGLWIFRHDWSRLTGLEGHRLGWALTALRMFQAHPLLGVGPGAFGEAYPLYRGYTWGLNSLFAHSFPLEMLAEKGVVGAAAFLGTAAWALRRGGSGTAAVSAGGFCFHNLVHFGFSFPSLAWLFWTVTALGPNPRAFPREGGWPWRRAAPALALIGLFTVLISVTLSPRDRVPPDPVAHHG